MTPSSTQEPPHNPRYHRVSISVTQQHLSATQPALKCHPGATWCPQKPPSSTQVPPGLLPMSHRCHKYHSAAPNCQPTPPVANQLSPGASLVSVSATQQPPGATLQPQVPPDCPQVPLDIHKCHPAAPRCHRTTPSATKLSPGATPMSPNCPHAPLDIHKCHPAVLRCHPACPQVPPRCPLVSLHSTKVSPHSPSCHPAVPKRHPLAHRCHPAAPRCHPSPQVPPNLSPNATQPPPPLSPMLECFSSRQMRASLSSFWWSEHSESHRRHRTVSAPTPTHSPPPLLAHRAHAHTLLTRVLAQTPAHTRLTHACTPGDAVGQQDGTGMGQPHGAAAGSQDRGCGAVRLWGRRGAGGGRTSG